MRKIINNRIYDTDKAHLVGEYDNGSLPTDSEYIAEALYRKKTGEYFLHGEGGPRTMYACTRGSRWSSGERIMPYDYDAAMEWAQEHLSVDAYEQEFGEVAEDESTCVLSCIISSASMTLIRRASQREGITIAAVVERLAQALRE